MKKKILQRIRAKEPIDDLVRCYKPWYSSNGDVLGHRYYHYYSYRELSTRIRKAGLSVIERRVLGGKTGDENFFVLVKANE